MDRSRLQDLEEGFWHAAGDPQAYERHLAPDAIHVFPGWGVADREAVLAGVAEADPWSDVTIDDPRVVAVGEDVVALAYRASAHRPGTPAYVAAVTSVYRRTAGDWELVLHQQTPLADDER